MLISIFKIKTIIIDRYMQLKCIFFSETSRKNNKHFISSFFIFISFFPMSQSVYGNPAKINIYSENPSLNIIVVQKSKQLLTVFSSRNGNLQAAKQYSCSTGKVKGDKSWAFYQPIIEV